MEMKDIHAKVFNILYGRRLANKSFRFSLRRTNRFGRLSKGYWFHGNDNYLAVSFWSGMDWMNKTPNIFFVVHSDGSTKLEISVTDSESKYDYVRSYIYPALKEYHKIDLNLESNSNEHYYDEPDFVTSLERFLSEEKESIDNVIRAAGAQVNSTDNFEPIGFIDEQSFITHLNNILQYRSNQEREQVGITSIDIKNFGDIRNEGITLTIPPETRWVFLTGENGTGKTTILRGITLGLIPNSQRRFDLDDSGHYEIVIDLNFKVDRQRSHQYRSAPIIQEKTDNPRSIGFAAYGSSRLNMADNFTKADSDDHKMGIDYGIFHSDGMLLNINLLQNLPGTIEIRKERLAIIQDLLSDKELIPQIANVLFHDGEYNRGTTFIEKDPENRQYPNVTFNRLASGVRSMVALLSDMLIRLFRQQPDISDPAELCGVVLIDEIDIHLHPAMQKKIVEILASNFPNLQFIVTTHSAITLLGAPPNSVFYRISRDRSTGVVASRIDIDVKNLTPNIILTSPIFGMSGVLSRQIEAEQTFEELRTEDSYPEMKVVDRSLESLVKKYLSRTKNANND